MVGHLTGHPGKVPPVWNVLEMSSRFLDRVVGTKVDRKLDPKAAIKPNTALMLNIGTAKTVGIISAVAQRGELTEVTVGLKLPVCAQKNARIAISTQIEGRWRLVGYAQLTGGKELS